MSKNSEVGPLTEIRSSKVDSLSLDDYLEEWGRIPKCKPRNQETFPESVFQIPLPCVFRKVGLTGFEPVTLRLSSACSNQLSYRPLERLRVFG